MSIFLVHTFAMLPNESPVCCSAVSLMCLTSAMRATSLCCSVHLQFCFAMSASTSYSVKSLGTAFWCLCYISLTLQGLFTPGKRIFCPWPHKAMAYCVVWEAALSWAKPKLGAWGSSDISSSHSKNTRLLFFAWFVFDCPLMALFLYGGNGTIGENIQHSRNVFFIELFFSAAIHYAFLRNCDSFSFFFIKYFSIVYDIYMSYTMYEVFVGRGVVNIADLLAVILKLLADGCYLFPMVSEWMHLLPTHQNKSKALFVIISGVGVWVSNVILLCWSLMNVQF
uniref:Uncharacterized protein n=1 Tax=Spongospora subterranea TaxID=70186 RepID=A0A0H5RMS1_9EUKA|eukprot:CRZ10024.1 hypothetical protein [Spongospora subterranea]